MLYAPWLNLFEWLYQVQQGRGEGCQFRLGCMLSVGKHPAFSYSGESRGWGEHGLDKRYQWIARLLPWNW